jgi:hypothetical protein
VVSNQQGKQPDKRLAGTKLAAACWEGYEAIGTKVKDGRTVPNCVPIKRA